MTRGQYGNIVGQAPWGYPYSNPSYRPSYQAYPIPPYQMPGYPIPTYQYPAYQYPAYSAAPYSVYQYPGFPAYRYPAPAPQYAAPQYPVPQYTAPQYAPQYPAQQYAPQYAPQYSAPQYTTPQYPAPAYQYEGAPPTTAPPVAAPVTRPAPVSPPPAQAPRPAPAPAPVVPLGTGVCGVREYGNVTAPVRDAILAKLREENMTVTGNNPWSVDTTKEGVKLRAAWDPQSQILRVIVSDWGPLAKIVGCERVWSEINPVLTNVIQAASATVSGWHYGYAHPYGYSYYGYPSVGWF